MSGPRVLAQNNGRIMGGRARPGLVIDTGHRAIWVDLADVADLSDQLIDALETAEARDQAARLTEHHGEEIHP